MMPDGIWDVKIMWDRKSGKWVGKSTQTFTEKKTNHNVYFGEVKI